MKERQAPAFLFTKILADAVHVEVLKMFSHANCYPYNYVTLHRKISHNAGEEFLELARAGQSTFNQLSFSTKISFIPGSVPELRHFEGRRGQKVNNGEKVKNANYRGWALIRNNGISIQKIEFLTKVGSSSTCHHAQVKHSEAFKLHTKVK